MSKEEIIAETSKEVVQSYLLTVAGRDWGIYAEKFLLKLVEAAQRDVQGLDFKHGRDTRPHRPSLDYPGIEKKPDGDVLITIPVKDLLPSEEYKNYNYIREAIESLQTKIIRWEAPKIDNHGRVILNSHGNPVRMWKSVQLVGEAGGKDDGEGNLNSCITVRINTNIWTAMLDFTRGFRAFDLRIAMKLQSKYSFRLYQLMSRQDQPLTYTIDDLRKQWGLENKYDRVDDFIKRTIKPAKEELDAVSPYTFDYKVQKSNAPGRGNKPVASIIFYPRHQVDYENPKSIRGFDETQMLKESVRHILKDKYGFTWIELQTTFDIMYTCQKTMTGDDSEHPKLTTFLDKISRKASQSKNPKGYVIAALKKHLKEKYNVVFKSKKEQAADEKIRRMASERNKNNAEKEPARLGDLME